jgi:hypothetical protein
MKAFTLADFFGHAGIDAPQLEKLQKTELVETLRKNLPGTESAIHWNPAWNSIIDHISKLLDIDIAEIMLKAWKNCFDLRKYADTNAFPPDRTFLEPLIEHTITSKHKPEIVVEIDHAFKKTIPFEITLELLVKGLTLEISAGKIMKIHTGEITGKGSVECLNVILLEKKSGPLAIPGIIELGNGIALAS